MIKLSALLFAGLLATTAVGFVACDDSTSNVNGNNDPFNPGGGNDGGNSTPDGGNGNPDGGNGNPDGGSCQNKPVGCFCGTPTTQAQWLNRCTNSAALPVNLNVKAATTADIP